jgi:hypothetical protein
MMAAPCQERLEEMIVTFNNACLFALENQLIVKLTGQAIVRKLSTESNFPVTGSLTTAVVRLKTMQL